MAGIRAAFLLIPVDVHGLPSRLATATASNAAQRIDDNKGHLYQRNQPVDRDKQKAQKQQNKIFDI